MLYLVCVCVCLFLSVFSMRLLQTFIFYFLTRYRRDAYTGAAVFLINMQLLCIFSYYRLDTSRNT